jgi:hypothetical protein
MVAKIKSHHDLNGNVQSLLWENLSLANQEKGIRTSYIGRDFEGVRLMSWNRR